MKDEIKEIKENIKPTLEWLKECSEYNWIFETSNSSELFNYITNLQKEKEDYKSRCEKANEYIMSNLITEWDIKNGGEVSGSDLPADAITPILDIIDGVDEQ